MKKIIILASIFLIFISGDAYATVDYNEIQKTLNCQGQQIYNQTNKPQLSDKVNESEYIDPITGALTLKNTDLSLPGKDGLNLDVSRIYKTTDAQFGSSRFKVLESKSEGSPSAQEGWYVEVRIYDTSTGAYLTPMYLGVWDDWGDAFDVYSTYVDFTYGNYEYYPEILDGTISTSQLTHGEFTYNAVEKFNYSQTRYDLGVGWSFGFPSLQKNQEWEDSYILFHDGNGNTYHVVFTSDNTDSNLENYKCKDVMFEHDSGTFSYNGVSSAYKFTDAEKKTTYFANNGAVIGIKDRIENQIRFKYINRSIDGKSYPFITQITDSVGRTIDFAYNTVKNNGTYDHDEIVLTVHDPSNTTSMQIIYRKGRDQITYYTNEIEKEQFYRSYLYGATDPNNQTTYYDEYLNGNSNYIKFNYNHDDITDPYYGWMGVKLLQRITYPHMRTCYTYNDKTTRDLGDYGISNAYRVTHRRDSQLRLVNDNWDYTLASNYQDYEYHNEPDLENGYYQNEDLYNQMTNEYVFTDGSKVRTTSNEDKQIIQRETVAQNNEKEATKNLEFDTTFTFNPTKTEISKYDSNGTLVRQLYVGTTYNDWGGVASVTMPLTATQYNDTSIKQKYTTSYQYDSTFRFISQKQWYQNDSTLVTESYTYDTLGRVLTYTNPKSEVMTYTYTTDSEGDKIQVTKQLENSKLAKKLTVYGVSTAKAYPTQIKNYYTNDQGVYTETTQTNTYDMLLGLVASQSDNSGRTTSYTYDNLGRPTLIQKHNFTNIDNQIYSSKQDIIYSDDINLMGSNAVDQNATLASRKVYSKETYTNNGTASTYNETNSYYDAYGNLRLEEAKDSAQGTMKVRTQFLNDNMMRVVKHLDGADNAVNYSYDGWGRLNEVVDALGNLERSDYDIINNKVTNYFVAQANVINFRTNPDNSYKENLLEEYSDQWDRPVIRKAYPNWPTTTGAIQESYTYDIVGNILTYTDPKGNLNDESVTAKYIYDNLNRLVTLKDAKNQITSANYNILGNVSSVKMKETSSLPEQTIFTKTYDEMGRQTLKEDPLSQDTTSAYNQLGQFIKLTDRKTSIFNYGYDEIGQMTSDQVGTLQYQYGFDKPFGASKAKDLVGGTQVGITNYTYDSIGRMTNATSAYTSDNYNSAWAQLFDNADRITDSSINTFNTKYKYTLSRLTKVQTNGQTAVDDTDTSNATYEYYPDGKLKKITYPMLTGNIYLTSEYEYNKLGRLTKVINKKGTNTLSEFTYGYDDNGNITSVIDATGPTLYQYDKLNRLTNITRPDDSTAVYDYDVKGNRKILQDNSATLDTDTVSYAYDLRNRLTSVTKGGVTTSIKYRTDGLRYKKTSGANTVLYHYNSNEKVVAEADGTGTVTADYVWGPDRMLVKKDVTSGNQYFYVYNGHGDVVQITNSNGQVLDKTGNIAANQTSVTYQYDAFGNEVNPDANDTNPFRYCGECYDKETGLYYLRARYYDPQLGRFINEDSFEGQVDDPLSLNLYTYCENEPLMHSDPTGHFVFAIPAAIGAVEWAVGTVITATTAYVAGSEIGTRINKSKVEPIAVTNRDTDKEDKITYIYRYTDKFDYQSLTPEPAGIKKQTLSGKSTIKKEDDKALSFSTISGKGWRTTIEKVNSSGTLIAIRDNEKHVSIKPNPIIESKLGTMTDWLTSFTNANSSPHLYSTILRILCSENK